MKYMQNYLSVAHAVAEPEGRHAGLLAEDAAQVRGVVVMETLGYLLYGQVGGVEQVLDHQPDLYVDLFLGSGAEIFTVDDVQVKSTVFITFWPSVMADIFANFAAGLKLPL